MKTAILVDGGYYRKLAKYHAGDKSPQERANELEYYCKKHLKNRDHFSKNGNKKIYDYNDLYRIFYYDCEPVAKKVYHPLKQQTVDFAKQPTYTWMNDFLTCLKQKKKICRSPWFSCS